MAGACLVIVLIHTDSHAEEAPARVLLEPLPSHPGNVYVAGEEVVVSLPESLDPAAVTWRTLDDGAVLIAGGSIAQGVNLGQLGVGWYEVEFLDANDQTVDCTTAAVLAPWKAPVPDNSPICLDAAVSWFATGDSALQDCHASLAALAGANWIRDRLRWREIEPERGQFALPTQYDEAARIQHARGLNVLQVWHDTPKWALNEDADHGRFAPDLRDVYHFAKAAARRFQGTVQAWEPWNEANSGNFGGQTIDEMCANQKAAFLGFKAGNPDAAVCWQPIGGVNPPAMAEGILANETWPYYEVYSIHSYDWPDSYDRLWEPARQAAAGRPIWVTESDRGMRPDADSAWGDFTREDAIKKAEFMAHSYATSLFSGASRHFHFILGHYMEQNGAVQFSLLRKDLTPRPSYVALAAVGRFLAGGTCLGRWHVDGQPDAHVYAFRAVPDGKARDVLVAWVETPGDWDKRGAATLRWALPADVSVLETYDYLGRRIDAGVPNELPSRAVYLLLAPNESAKLPLEPARSSEFRAGVPSSVVLQLEMPDRIVVDKTQGWTPQFERAIPPGTPTELRIVAYNFGDERQTGNLSFGTLPPGWQLTEREWNVTVPSMERALVNTTVTVEARSADDDASWVQVRGTFGAGPPATMAFRFFTTNPELPRSRAD
jgi:hypothetical protein